MKQKSGFDFRSLKRRIQNIGTSDYSMRRAITYRENYIKDMEKYSHFDNYDKLVALFNKYKNPVSFYELLSKNEMTVDLTYQSEQYYSQQAFNSFLEDLRN